MRHICKAIVSLLGGMLVATYSWAGADLNAIERKWLDAAEPVLDFARDQGLPIDIVVIHERSENDIPLSMGVREKRCKLVLAVRGDTEAEALLSTVPLVRQQLVIEAMTAHEIAHCWRYAQGDWHSLPAGFIESAEVSVSKELLAKKNEMRATRREEGYADLVALAWTLDRHPESYSEVHSWLEGVRSNQPLSGSFHDTRAWLALAKDRHALAKRGTPFEKVKELWAKGVYQED